LSTYLGRIRRVHTGWRAMPGKNLVVFDDAIVEARASALDGLAVTGLGFTGRAQQAVSAVGSAKNASLDQDPPSPQDLADQHPANWMIPISSVSSAVLTKRKLGMLTGATRRLVLHTDQGDRIVDWERQANPDETTIAMLKQALGERFSPS